MPLTFFYLEYEGGNRIRRLKLFKRQEITGTKRALQEEHGASTNEAAEEIQ